MNYKEALVRTEKLNQYAKEFNLGNILYIVVPADHQEMQLFLVDYYKYVSSQTELNCKEYSSEGDFLVYRIDNVLDSRKDFATSNAG